MTRLLEGEPVAEAVAAEVEELRAELSAAGVTPRVATVLMSDDPADRRFMALKREACAERDIAVETVDVPPSAPASDLHEAVERASADPGVHAIFVQVPLPDHVDVAAVRERVAPRADVDCFHPENLGRLLGDRPRFVPVTPRAVLRLLDAYDVAVAGRDVTVVGRGVIGLPLANLLLRDGPGGNATVTVCHSRTADLGAATRRADVVITAAAVPGLVDGSMLADGAVVVDVSANRVATDDGHAVVGDVDFASARERAAAITPVPGGVGPVTRETFLLHVVEAARRQELPGGGGEASS